MPFDLSLGDPLVRSAVLTLVIVVAALVTARLARRLVQRYVEAPERQYRVHYDVLTPFVYARITERGVQLTLRHLCEARRRRGAEHALTMAFLKRFQAHGDIDLAPGLRASVEASSLGAPHPNAGASSSGTPPPR